MENPIILAIFAVNTHIQRRISIPGGQLPMVLLALLLVPVLLLGIELKVEYASSIAPALPCLPFLTNEK